VKLRDEVQKARVEIQCLEKERETLLGQLRIFKETIASLEQQVSCSTNSLSLTKFFLPLLLDVKKVVLIDGIYYS